MTNEHDPEIGVGMTSALSLRVSVASLVRVLLSDSKDGSTMLALERIATLRKVDGRPVVTVRTKPFGGGVRLTNPQALRACVGDFRYDSERSREEQDFRIQIRPEAWEAVKEICRDHLAVTDRDILDASPERELAEEFEDNLGVPIRPDQYDLRPAGIAVEDVPVETDSVRAAGRRTVRVYYLFEAMLQDAKIIEKVLSNNRQFSDDDLERMAWDDVRRGGKGRANAVLIIGLEDLRTAYSKIPIESRGQPMYYGEHQLDGNVLAVLDKVDQLKYHRVL